MGYLLSPPTAEASADLSVCLLSGNLKILGATDVDERCGV